MLSSYFIDRNNHMLRDKVRATIAHVKLLYDLPANGSGTDVPTTSS